MQTKIASYRGIYKLYTYQISQGSIQGISHNRHFPTPRSGPGFDRFVYEVPNSVKPHQVSNSAKPHQVSNSAKPYQVSNSAKPHQVPNSVKSHQVSNSAKTDLRVKFNFQNILKYSYIEERSSTSTVNQL